MGLHEVEPNVFLYFIIFAIVVGGIAFYLAYSNWVDKHFPEDDCEEN